MTQRKKLRQQPSIFFPVCFLIFVDIGKVLWFNVFTEL